MDQVQPKSIPEDPDGFTPAYNEDGGCTGCYFRCADNDWRGCSVCTPTYRPEGRDVIFIKKER